MSLIIFKPRGKEPKNPGGIAKQTVEAFGEEGLALFTPCRPPAEFAHVPTTEVNLHACGSMTLTGIARGKLNL